MNLKNEIVKQSDDNYIDKHINGRVLYDFKMLSNS